ncbi:MAG: hypothetical protein ACR2QM_00795, partial [Longimicrobiales bacterium]
MTARLRTYSLVLAAFAVVAGVALLRPLFDRPPTVADVGDLGPVYAKEAERIDVKELSDGETFGQILDDAGLNANDQNGLLLAFQEQASPRRMRVGTEVRLVWRGDREALKGIEVDVNKDETVQLAQTDLGWVSSKDIVKTTGDTIYVAGQIGGILWNAVMDHPDLMAMPAGDRARVIHRLDQVFQWQVDFSRQIRKGDFYRFAFH